MVVIQIFASSGKIEYKIKMSDIPTHAKAALFYGPGDVRVENVAVPRPQKGEVLVRIGAALTCGTDQKTFKRGHPVIIKSIPSAFGHEMAGTIAAVGGDVGNFNIGDRVVIANSAPCFQCFYCHKKEYNLCSQLTFLNGAYAEYILVPAMIVKHNLHPIAKKLSFAAAALAEPLACVLHAARHTCIKQGDVVAILGTGPMAFLFVQVVRVLGGESIVIGRSTERLQMALQAGARAVIDNTKEEMAAAVKKITHGEGADVAIEAIGDPATWQAVISLVRRGGRVCFYGGCARGTTLELDTYRLHYEEISVSGVFHHTPPLFKEAVEWLDQDKIDTSFYTHEKRSLADVVPVFSGQEKTRPLKFVIEP